MAHIQLKLLVLKTRQMDKLRAFYEAVGVELVEERHGKGPVHYAGRVGSTVLEVYPLPEGDGDATTRLGFGVEDVDAVLAELQRIGAATMNPPQETPWGYRAVVSDPDGRAVELYRQDGVDTSV